MMTRFFTLPRERSQFLHCCGTVCRQQRVPGHTGPACAQCAPAPDTHFPKDLSAKTAAEDRARGEYMSKTLAKVRLEIDQGATPPPGWNVDEPWDDIWGVVLRDKEYWSEQVHVPGQAIVPYRRAGRQLPSRWPTGTSARDGRAGGRHRRQKKEQGAPRGEEEEAQGRSRGAAELHKRLKRWRRQGFWRGVLRLEQWEWLMRGAPTWRTLQKQK